MKVLVQRVKEAQVVVDNEIMGAIKQGALLLVGFTQNDGQEEMHYLAEKLVHLRIFEDDQQKMNRSLLDVGGALLSVSQFTLYGDCSKGRRPHFMNAAPPALAESLYEEWNQILRSYDVQVETGVFGAHMKVSLTNDGPVTFLLER